VTNASSIPRDTISLKALVEIFLCVKILSDFISFIILLFVWSKLFFLFFLSIFQFIINLFLAKISVDARCHPHVFNLLHTSVQKQDIKLKFC